jgi:serine/threonine protein kinase
MAGGRKIATGAAAEEWKRRDRSPEESAAALAALHELKQPEPRDSYVGRDVGPFKVEAFIESSRGMSTYIGIEEESRQHVLLRLYPLQGTYGAEFKALAGRAERPARVQAPALMVCLGTGRSKDVFFVGHEIPIGETLAELQANGETIDEKEILSIVRQISTGLKVLHSRQFAHGAISLETIRRERPGVYVLEDAGVCRAKAELSFLSGGGEVVGEPGFIAPEAVDTGEPSPAADLYSLGCVAWALLVGRAPFAGLDTVQVLLDQLNGEVPELLGSSEVKVSDGAAILVKKLTGYAHSVRYPNVADLTKDLDSIAKGRAIKPYPSDLVEDSGNEFGVESESVSGGTALLVVLLVLDLLLVGAIAMTYTTAVSMPFEDPIRGYELPMPGITDGGYRTKRSRRAPAKRSSAEEDAPSDDGDSN